MSALSVPGPLGLLGPAALAVSVFLTAMYLLDVLIKAFAPLKGSCIQQLEEVPGPRIKLSLFLLTSLTLILAFTSSRLHELLSALIAAGSGGV